MNHSRNWNLRDSKNKYNVVSPIVSWKIYLSTQNTSVEKMAKLEKEGKFGLLGDNQIKFDENN